eukprot:6203503-Pleurochrysis_carterae.AAC.3
MHGRRLIVDSRASAHPPTKALPTCTAYQTILAQSGLYQDLHVGSEFVAVPTLTHGAILCNHSTSCQQSHVITAHLASSHMYAPFCASHRPMHSLR